MIRAAASEAIRKSPFLPPIFFNKPAAPAPLPPPSKPLSAKAFTTVPVMISNISGVNSAAAPPIFCSPTFVFPSAICDAPKTPSAVANPLLAPRNKAELIPLRLSESFFNIFCSSLKYLCFSLISRRMIFLISSIFLLKAPN